MTKSHDWFKRRYDTLDLQRMDTVELIVLLKAEADRRAFLADAPVELAFVSSKIIGNELVEHWRSTAGEQFFTRKSR